MLTVDQMRLISPHCDADALTSIISRVAPECGINTLDRLEQWLAQVYVETDGFLEYSENLNYSAEGLLRMWPSHFSFADARVYAHDPQRIANRAYANRMGNGDEASGDGWRYRGRGAMMTTGKANYETLKTETGIDVVGFPDLLAGIGEACFMSAGKFWQLHGCNELADRGLITRITLRVNGGLTNISQREAAYANIHHILSES